MGYQVKIYKSQLLSYIPAINNWNLKLKAQHHSHEHQTSEIRGINLTKYVQDLYEENHKTLMSKTKAQRNNWRDLHIHRQEDNIIKM